MLTLSDILAKFNPALESHVVETYIQSQWIRPAQTNPEYGFADIDLARLQLVQFLKHGMDANEDLIDIVLGLVDQIYGMREQMRQLQQQLINEQMHN